LDLTSHQIDQRGCIPAIRNVNHVDAGHRVEQLSSEMSGAADAGRRHGDFAWVGAGVGDELGNGSDRQRGIDFHDIRHAQNGRNGCDVAGEIEG
jgi:hypothetical protein